VSTTDMAGKPVRQPGKTGRGRRPKNERQAASRAAQDSYWAERVARTSSPVQALRVLTDRTTSVALQAERRAATALRRVQASGDQAATAVAERRLASVRADITADISQILEALTAFAERHQTTRV
jgi:hypothetical protein